MSQPPCHFTSLTVTFTVDALIPNLFICNREGTAGVNGFLSNLHGDPCTPRAGLEARERKTEAGDSSDFKSVGTGALTQIAKGCWEGGLGSDC